MPTDKKIEFSRREKFKLKGTGSPRIEYKSGITIFDDVEDRNSDLHFVNCEIYKNGLLFRSSRAGINQEFFAYKSNISIIHLWIKRYKVFSYFKWWIKYDGTLTIKNDNSEIIFHIPQVYFKPFKNFLNKAWIHEIVKYDIDPSPPEILKFASALSFFNR